MHILVISLCARHSKNLECSKPVQGLKQLALVCALIGDCTLKAFVVCV